MTDIRSKIDELIEESYLATLPEEAIRKDLLQFLDACDQTAASTSDERKRQEMDRRLRSFKEMALRIDNAPELADQADQWTAWSQHDLIAHRAARMKLLVLDALRAVDSSVAEMIERSRFPHGAEADEPTVTIAPRPSVRPPRPWMSPTASTTLLRACYALLAGITLFIIGYRLFH